MELEITIDQNLDVDIEIPDVTAALGQKVLIQFFSNKQNIFNLATENLGGKPGEVVITDGASYDFSVPAALAVICKDTDVIEWELFKIIDDAVDELLHFGSVVVIPLEASEPGPIQVPYFNLNRYRPSAGAPAITLDDDVTHLDDTVVFTPAEGTELNATIPAASTMPGKKLRLYNNGEGLVNVFDGVSVIFVIAEKSDSLQLEASPQGWLRF